MEKFQHAKYVGTMIGPEGHLYRWTAPRKEFIQRTSKINGTARSLVERLIDFKENALSVLGYLVPTRCNALLLDLTKPFLLTSYVLDLCAALVSTFFGIRVIRIAARFRTVANSSTPVDCLAKIRADRENDGASPFRPFSRTE